MTAPPLAPPDPAEGFSQCLLLTAGRPECLPFPMHTGSLDPFLITAPSSLAGACWGV